MKLVVIEWVDSHSGRGWQNIERIKNADQPLPVQSVGWLLKRTNEVYILAAHLSKDEEGNYMQGAGDMVIPARAVKKIRTLEDL